VPAADPIKVYDARWEVHDFDDAAIRRLFEATLIYARRYDVDTIILSRDARLHAGHVVELALDVALRMGFRVYLSPHASGTPHAYFMSHYISRTYPGTMGLAVTASHNPADYIGVKFTVPTVQAIGLDCGPDGGLTAIRKIYHSNEKPEPKAGGTVEILDLLNEYVDFSLEQAKLKPGDLDGLSIVMDTMNGSAGPELLAALHKAGVAVEALRLVPDGTFPTGSPNPTSLGKMDEAVARAQQNGHILALGVDGDGDRLVFGDSRGILAAGFVTIPILKAVGLTGEGSEPQSVLYDPKVNPLALAEWGRLHAKPVLFRNGHSQIKDHMRRINAIAAAEESGHYYHRITMNDSTVYCENNLLTALLFLESLKRQPGMMDELWSLQNRVSTTGEFNYQFPDNDVRDRALGDLVESFDRDGAVSTTRSPDGADLHGTLISKGITIKGDEVQLDSGWFSGYLRVATNERGVVRSYFSTGDPDRLTEIETTARGLLEGHGGQIIE
jgi:phosphomannomutase